MLRGCVHRGYLAEAAVAKALRRDAGDDADVTQEREGRAVPKARRDLVFEVLRARVGVGVRAVVRTAVRAGGLGLG